MPEATYHNAHIATLRHAIEQLKPLPEKILLRVLERPEKYEGSSILRDVSEAHYSPSDRGVVLAKGTRVLAKVAPGDVVIFRWQGGDDFECQGHHLIFLEDAELRVNLGPESETGPRW